MTRDYAKKPAPRSAPRSQVPGWVWLFTGSILGGFIVFLIYLADQPADPAAASTQLNKEKSPAPLPKPKVEWTFYEKLPRQQVKVKTEEKTANHSNTQNIEYLLQAGSFRSDSDADSLRAQLLLLDLKAYVEKAVPRPNETWFRVLVGPFSSRSQMAKARQALLSNNIEALVLKRKL